MRTERDPDWPALAAIAAVFAAGWMLVRGGTDVPVIDDWVYAWSVENLVKTGRLQVLEFSAIYPIAQIVWGALFAAVAGFSFGAVRLSIVVLSACGCGAVYLTLRELGCRRVASLIGALALALDPLYFALSFSFMTEVPFVSFSSIALYCYVRSIARGDSRALWAGSWFALCAFLVRPIGIALPLAALAGTLTTSQRWTALRKSLPAHVAALVVMVLLQVVLPRLFGPLDWAANRAEYLEWVLSIPLTTYLKWTLELLLIGLFPLSTVFVAFAAGRRRALAVAGVALVIGALCYAVFDAGWSPLPNWQTWSLQDIAARAMIDGRPPLSSWSQRMMPLVRAVGVVTLSSFVLVVFTGLLRPPRWGQAEYTIVLLGLAHVGMIHVLWLYNDRYYITLAPMFAILGARALDRRRASLAIAGGVLTLWAAIAVTGTRDMLAFNEACASAARELEAQGIPPWEVDAGYVLNGWRLYAHPEHLPPGANRRGDVPYVTSQRTTEYSIANRPPAGSQVIEVVPLPTATWQASRQVYVVKNTVR
jgi:hypothetical protein